MSGYDERSAGLRDSVIEAIRAQIVEVNTCMPGEVVSFDAGTQSATIQLCLEREVLGTTEPITQLEGVPMMVQSGGGFSVTFPVNAGDPCLVLFAQRGIDNWYLDGRCQPQATRRHHHLSDAVFIPGLKPLPDALGGYATDKVTIRTDGGQALFSMTADGRFQVTNGSEDLLDLVDELIGVVADLKANVTTGSSTGLHAHDQIPALNALQSRLSSLRG